MLACQKLGCFVKFVWYKLVTNSVILDCLCRTPYLIPWEVVLVSWNFLLVWNFLAYWEGVTFYPYWSSSETFDLRRPVKDTDWIFSHFLETHCLNLFFINYLCLGCFKEVMHKGSLFFYQLMFFWKMTEYSVIFPFFKYWVLKRVDIYIIC